MPCDDDPILAAYALSGYPFSLEALNPLVRDTDDKLIAEVDGWRQSDQLLAFLERRKHDGGVIVIAGGSGTGRTSMTNYAIAAWRSVHALERDKVVTVARLAESADAAEQIWQWSLSIRSRILRARLELDDLAQEALRDIRDNPPKAVAAAVGEALAYVAEDLSKSAACVVGVLERIAAKEFLSVARDITNLSGILLIATVDQTALTEEKVLNEVGLLGESGLVLRLGQLSGAEVADVVHTRWRHYSATEPPFTALGIEAAFAEAQRPLKGAITYIDAVLQTKLLDFPKTQPWPAGTELGFKDEELKRKIGILDSLRRQ